MKALYAEFTAIDAASAEKVSALLSDLADSVKLEPGNVTFDAHRIDGHPNVFFVYEVYRDEDAFAEHLGQEHGVVFNAELTRLVVGGKSELTFLRPVSDGQNG